MMNKTEMYEAVIGVIPGYKPGEDIKNKVISGIVEECKAVYPVEWGAPIGGEYCFKITFTRNPEFDKDKNTFYHAVLENVKRLKEYFHQSTVTLTVNDWGRISIKRFVEDKDFEEEM